MPATKSAERSYHHGDLARALIRAALELLEEGGVAALSLREVARRAGVSHAAPAHHFGDKAGLLTAIAIEGFERFGEVLRRVAREAGPEPGAALRDTGRAYVHFAAEQRAYFELMFRPESLRNDDPALRAASGAAYQVLLDAVHAAQETGLARGEDPRAVALMSWAIVHGIAKLWLDGNLSRDLTLDLDETIDMALGPLDRLMGA